MNNQQIIDKFFESYAKRDLDGIRQVVSEDVIWYFLGQHKLAGIKKGIAELISFFDRMGAIMSQSKPNIEKLIVSEKGRYLIECQHIKTNREDGINIDHHASVLWTIENGKIIEGRHFFADPVAVDQYFTAVADL
jgi:ketosteroid isomerase-like protein